VVALVADVDGARSEGAAMVVDGAIDEVDEVDIVVVDVVHYTAPDMSDACKIHA
jgi:hypothetical protein